VGKILVIDDDVTRHGDHAGWSARIGIEVQVRETPPEPPLDFEPEAIVVHAGYGRRREGFPRDAREAEAIRWLLDDPSYLFHEELEAFRELGRSVAPDVPLVVMTGGSVDDLPVDAIRALAGARPVAAWNVLDMVGTTSLAQLVAGPVQEEEAGAEPDPDRIAGEVRHDLLNRLWNLALAAGEAAPDVEELREIRSGDADQSDLDVLVARAPSIGEDTRDALTRALVSLGDGAADPGLAALARRAISEIESA